MNPLESTDLELLAAWRAGDLTAGEALLERHYAAIHRFFVHKTGSDCEDLIQTTFLGCIEAVDRFRAEASFRTLLFAIAWNTLCKHQRARKRIPDPLDSQREPPAASAPSFGTLLDGRQDIERLRKAMGQLPDDTQVMLELFYWEGMLVHEIAEVLDRPLNTVKTRMSRGRKQLRKELAALQHSTRKG